MSRKVIWIWSFNNRQQTVGSPNGMIALRHPFKFQRGIRQILAPDWTVEFISDDFQKNSHRQMSSLSLDQIEHFTQNEQKMRRLYGCQETRLWRTILKESRKNS